jgi:hypothetical protein
MSGAQPESIADQRIARRLGAGTGLGLATLWLIPAAIATGDAAALLTVAIPTLLAASAAGWLIGPRAVKAGTRGESFLAIFLMALTGIVIGAILIAAMIVALAALEGASSPAFARGITIASLIAAWPAVASAGILLVGPFVLPTALVASTIWYFALRSWTRRMRA